MPYHRDVRITLSLDGDVAKRLRKEIRRVRDFFMSGVNRCLRLAFSKSSVVAKPFVVHPRPLGVPSGNNCDCVPELLESLEGISPK
jgi:hypothetical protein